MDCREQPDQRADSDDADEDELSHDRHLFKADLTANETDQSRPN
jgi:hypothetical protein